MGHSKEAGGLWGVWDARERRGAEGREQGVVESMQERGARLPNPALIYCCTPEPNQRSHLESSKNLSTAKLPSHAPSRVVLPFEGPSHYARALPPRATRMPKPAAWMPQTAAAEPPTDPPCSPTWRFQLTVRALAWATCERHGTALQPTGLPRPAVPMLRPRTHPSSHRLEGLHST